jgi:hypothetical protein
MDSRSDQKELAWVRKNQNGSSEIIKEVISQEKLNQRLEEIRLLHGEVQWIERTHWDLETAFRNLRKGEEVL